MSGYTGLLVFIMGLSGSLSLQIWSILWKWRGCFFIIFVDLPRNSSGPSVQLSFTIFAPINPLCDSPVSCSAFYSYSVGCFMFIWTNADDEFLPLSIDFWAPSEYTVFYLIFLLFAVILFTFLLMRGNKYFTKHLTKRGKQQNRTRIILRYTTVRF